MMFYIAKSDINPNTLNMCDNVMLIFSKDQIMHSHYIMVMVCACLIGSVGSADLLVYDGMDYPVTNSIHNLNGGIGWRTPWYGANKIVTSSLKYVNAGKVSTTGNAMCTDNDWNGAIRQIGTTNYPDLLERHGKFGKNGTAIWISFLMKKESTYLSVWGGVSLFDDSIERVFIGAPYNSHYWGFEEAVLERRHTSDVRIRPKNTVFLCMRIRFVDGNDICSLWVNPPLDRQPDEWNATEGEIADFMFDQLRFASSEYCIVDEIRIATTWQDVMPTVPVITNYVSPQGAHIPPFSSWATASTNIQSAINMNNADIILVLNGIYLSSAEITITNQLIVTSLNGPLSTVINGNNDHRCVYIDHPDAEFNGFTCSNGYVFGDGGGGYLKNGIIDRCIFVNNSATNGGGLYIDNNGPVYNSLFYNNSAVYGGGICADIVDLYNCTIVDNTATNNGAAASYRSCDLRNCIMYYNQDSTSDYKYVSCFYSCVPPELTDNYNCITNAPMFLNKFHSNYRLMPGSPCIDNKAGLSYEYYDRDLDGRQRILNAKKDMGAFEFGGALKCYCYASVPIKEFPQPVFFSSRIEGTNVHGLLYEWDFESDGHFDVSGPTLATVTNVYSEEGVFSVTLKVSNTAGEEFLYYATNLVHVYAPKTRFVSLSGLSIPPYTNWLSAAVSLSNALSVAQDGDTILFDAGTYYINNNILVTQAISIISVHGPLSTVFDYDGIKYITITLKHDKARLNGFTLSHSSDTAFQCEQGNIFNCSVTDNSKTGVTLLQGIITNCWIYNNGEYGIYAYSGPNILVENCVVFSNELKGIHIRDVGRINNCIIRYNREGGIKSMGYRSIIVEKSIIHNNGRASLPISGAGLDVTYTVVQNCLVMHNSCGISGGGVYAGENSKIVNCTIVGNSAYKYGGIFNRSIAYNTIVYYNVASDVSNCYANYRFVNCCIPEDHGGINIITNKPLFLIPGDYHLRPASPCINTGTNLYDLLSDTDLEGTPRIIDGRVDIGIYEYGPLRCAFTANPTEVLTDDIVTFSSVTVGTNLNKVSYLWHIKNSHEVIIPTEQNTLEHAFSSTGYYTVTLTSYNANNESWDYTKTNCIHVIPEGTSIIYILLAFVLIHKNSSGGV